MTLKLDLRFVVGVLTLVILGMLFAWQPWDSTGSRTVVVSGQATVKAVPDEFTFYPSYQSTAATSAKAISKVSVKGNAVVAKLIKLGVVESKIRTDVSTSNDDGRVIPMVDSSEPDSSAVSSSTITATFAVTAVVNDSKLAQKISDYLTTTSPLYGVSPSSGFTTETSKRLENEARGEALADAKARADQTVTTLGAKLGKVIEVSEPNWGGPIMMEGDTGSMSKGSVAPTTPRLLFGEQEVTYSVSVTYRLK
ncbi:hypothetical protein A3A71_00250 [Candidatus Berkelbacteria bacterium RIFCSPLOWO2_01_FULL_50_28]|uniref:DUF541 domain-containing protein n=1 Tax=Candidatus Berkelbacteria bacterium RIFCSPLOWO2_01_FULL_50_28 TaxID=1797471 RepID=A0A1F5EB00_9BACT|nr:MAG: hypothetical protein A2807_00180 [Candidatus Berkelbacteria bacterium RIFCSPHIGHO2_01_FULL_50_36]OGD62824.1 MAG: hypothetical protein A3F39_02250 [Candidatus Berkelbacteria bacterium RIFCSPHIGHO2_12_FULL_50_11]OGD64480.1 MAG: hypothetical protein A3A71_00250 [Candidatus Berkelbacteria bacterium RIFCSPLOWO2_01_FULL_50_28]